MGYYDDLWKQVQEEDAAKTAARNAPPPPPEPAPMGGILGWLEKLSETNQRYNLGNLEKSGTGGFWTKALAGGANLAGKAIGAPFAALGAFTQAGPMGYPVLRDDYDKSEPLQATSAGMEAGGQSLKENITPVDLLSLGANPVARTFSGLDTLMGAGDVSRATREEDPTKKGVGIATGLARMAGGTVGTLSGPPPKSPRLQSATAQAASSEPIKTGGEESFFRATEPPQPVNTQVTPEAMEVLRVGATGALSEANRLHAAQGRPTPLQNIVFLDETGMVTLADGSPHQITGNAGVLNDTLYITQQGAARLLQADDALGVMRRVGDLVAHEVNHPALEAGRPTTSVDPITGQPMPDMPLAGERGHGEGRFMDDRTADLDQILADFSVAEAIHKSPGMQAYAARVAKQGLLNNAFQGQSPVSMTAGTYSPDVLQLGYELAGREAPSYLEPSNAPRPPEVQLIRTSAGKELTPPSVNLPRQLTPPPGRAAGLAAAKLSGGGERFDPLTGKPRVPAPEAAEKPSTQLSPDEELVEVPEPSGRLIRALTNTPPKELADLANLPETYKYMQRKRAGLSMRGGEIDFQKMIQELVTAKRRGLARQGTFERLGIGQGDFFDLANNLNARLERTIGKNSPEGLRLRAALHSIRKTNTRLFAQHKRKLRAIAPDAKPEHIAQQQRLEEASFLRARPDFRKISAKSNAKLIAKLDASDAADAARMKQEARAKEALRETIVEANMLPPKTQPERLAAAVTELKPQLSRLQRALRFLDPRTRFAGADRGVQAERTTRKSAWGVEEEQRVSQKATEAASRTEPLGLSSAKAPRLAKPPKPKQAGGAERTPVPEKLRPLLGKMGSLRPDQILELRKNPELLAEQLASRKVTPEPKAREFSIDRLKNVLARIKGEPKQVGKVPGPKELPPAPLGKVQGELAKLPRRERVVAGKEPKVAAALRKEADFIIGRGAKAKRVESRDLRAFLADLTAKGQEQFRKLRGMKGERKAPSTDQKLEDVKTQEQRSAFVRKEAREKGLAAKITDVKEWSLEKQDEAKGTFKVAPKEYKIPEDVGEYIDRATRPEPLHALAGEVLTDQSSLGRLSRWLKANDDRLKAAKGLTLNSGVIDAMKFTHLTNRRLQRALRDIQYRQGLEGEDALNAFKAELDDLAGELAGDSRKKLADVVDPEEKAVANRRAALELSNKRNKRPILHDIAQTLRGRKRMEFKRPTGPWGSRQFTNKVVRELEGKDGKPVQDVLGGPKFIQDRLLEELHIKVPLDDIRENFPTTDARFAGDKVLAGETKDGIAPVLDLGKELVTPKAGGKPVMRSKLLEPPKRAQNLWSLHDAVKVLVERARQADPAGDPVLEAHPLANVAERQPTSAYQLKVVSKFGKNFEYPGKGNQKASTGVPISLQPFQKSPALSTGKRPRTKPSDPKPGQVRVRTSPLDRMDVFGRSLVDLNEAAIDSPGIQFPRKAGDLTEVKEVIGDAPLAGEAAYVKRAVAEGMEALKQTLDELHANGRLKTKAQAEKLKAEGYDLPEVMEELSWSKGMRRPDIDTEAGEYWLDYTKMNKQAAKIAEAAKAEFRHEYESKLRGKRTEREEKRAAALEEQAYKKSLVPLPLTMKTKRFLINSWKDVPKVFGAGGTGQGVKELAGKMVGGRTPNIVQWVDLQMLRGNIPEGERNAAIDMLREKLVRSQEKVANKSKFTPPPSDKDMVLYAPKPKEAGSNPRQPRDIPPEVMDAINRIAPARLRGKSESTKRGWKTVNLVGESVNTIRPWVTAFDVSNPYRQTGQLTYDQMLRDMVRIVTDPKAKVETSFRKNTWDMLRTWASEDTGNQLNHALFNDPYFKQAQKYGMNFIVEGAPHESWQGKEMLDKIFEKIEKSGKIGGAVIKVPKWLINASKRSFEYYQNKAMRDAWKYGLEYMLSQKRANKTKLNVDELRGMAEHISEAASRGKMFDDKDLNTFANNVFYSANMTSSRARQLVKAVGLYGTYATPELRHYARMQALRAITGGAAMIGGVYAIAAATGLKPEFEYDPRSTNFGKVRIGNLAWDGGAGYFQFLRATAQLATGQEKARATGEIRPRSMGDTIWNFARSKFSPGATAIISMREKKNFVGEPINFKKNPWESTKNLFGEMLIPMSVQDINDVIAEEPRAAWLLPLMLMGTGMTGDAPSRSDAWRKPSARESLTHFLGGEASRGVQIRDKERVNRKELQRLGIAQPTLTSSGVTLPKRDKFGKLQSYRLDPFEQEQFTREYMPLVTDLINDFINTQAYQNLPDSKKSIQLQKMVYFLNKEYGVNKRARKDVLNRFKAGTLDLPEDK